MADLVTRDEGLSEVERDYKERRAAAQTLLEARDAESAPWPPDMPRPGVDRDAFCSDQYKVAFDLSCVAAGFAFFMSFVTSCWIVTGTDRLTGA